MPGELVLYGSEVRLPDYATFDPSPWVDESPDRSAIIVETKPSLVRLRCRCSQPLAIFPRKELPQEKIEKVARHILEPHLARCYIMQQLAREYQVRRQQMAMYQQQQRMASQMWNNTFNPSGSFMTWTVVY